MSDRLHTSGRGIRFCSRSALSTGPSPLRSAVSSLRKAFRQLRTRWNCSPGHPC